MRVLVGAFGDPGHTFPALALGRELVARGHTVLLQGWQRWAQDAEREGIEFAAAPEYHVFPTRRRPLKPYEAVARATEATRPLVARFEPDVVVNDILTLAPAFAAELEQLPRATVIPHVFPAPARGLPPYGLGAIAPRSTLGREFWRLAGLPTRWGLERGRRELNETRRRLCLPPLERPYGALSHQLTLVATLPELEYPRRWPEHVHITGPLQWEPPFKSVQPPPRDAPLVVVAPSTSQDRRQSLLAASLRGLARAPVRVLATFNRRRPPHPLPRPANARIVEWISYADAMRNASLVICHGGHGTLARALSLGKPVLVVPAAGDMGENGARLQWSGAGLMLPRRLMTPYTINAVVGELLKNPDYAARAKEIAASPAAANGADIACALLEQRFSRPQTSAQSSASGPAPSE